VRTPAAAGVVAALAMALPLSGCGSDAASPDATGAAPSTMPVRLQWNANSGYCGEAAFIAAGMTLGQYTSQWTARQLAAGSPDADQSDPENHLLLTWPAQGSTWQRAARAMRLQAEGFDPAEGAGPPGRGADAFLGWIEARARVGSRVIIGVLNNTNLLEEDAPGAPEYDHIVPVMRIGGGEITIGDNGLFRPFTSGANWGSGNTAGNPRHSTLYTAGVGAVQKSRAEANQVGAACPFSSGGDITNACAPWVYSIYDDSTGEGNYGVAIPGIVDRTPGGPVTAPVRVTTSTNNEGMQDQPEMPSPPPGKPMSLTATVTIPDPSREWRVYLYTDFADVPTGSFNAAATASPTSVARMWTIPAGSGATWSTTLPRARTDATYVFRAVPAPAP